MKCDIVDKCSDALGSRPNLYIINKKTFITNHKQILNNV